MDFSAPTLALILAAAFASAIIGGMGGFGTGIILKAALTPILGIKALIVIGGLSIFGSGLSCTLKRIQMSKGEPLRLYLRPPCLGDKIFKSGRQ